MASPYLILPSQSGLHYHPPRAEITYRRKALQVGYRLLNPLSEVILFLLGIREIHTYPVMKEVKDTATLLV